MLVGASLAIAGVVYQGIFRNPLVSPDILGVSNGACVGAALAILIGSGMLGIQAFAFVGGLIAVLLTMNLPRLIQRDSTIVLVLSGIIVSGFMMATLGLLKYLADPETQLADIVYWQLGSLTKSNYDNLFILSPIILLTTLGLFLMRWRINVLSLGDREAKLIGANIRLERGLMVVCATLLTASSVCLSGTIGWLGLVIPHLARLLSVITMSKAYRLPDLLVQYSCSLSTLSPAIYTFKKFHSAFSPALSVRHSLLGY